MSNVNFETLELIKKAIRRHIAKTLDEKPILKYDTIEHLPIVFSLETVDINGRQYQVSPKEILSELDTLVARKLVARAEEENVIFLTRTGIIYARS